MGGLATHNGGVDDTRHTARHEAGRLQKIDKISAVGMRHGDEGAVSARSWCMSMAVLFALKGLLAAQRAICI